MVFVWSLWLRLSNIVERFWYSRCRPRLSQASSPQQGAISSTRIYQTTSLILRLVLFVCIHPIIHSCQCLLSGLPIRLQTFGMMKSFVLLKLSDRHFQFMCVFRELVYICLMCLLHVEKICHYIQTTIFIIPFHTGFWETFSFNIVFHQAEWQVDVGHSGTGKIRSLLRKLPRKFIGVMFLFNWASCDGYGHICSWYHKGYLEIQFQFN